jgi:hypothetical protein
MLYTKETCTALSQMSLFTGSVIPIPSSLYDVFAGSIITAADRKMAAIKVIMHTKWSCISTVTK